jgi:PAS domain S-box-containing protein
MYGYASIEEMMSLKSTDILTHPDYSVGDHAKRLDGRTSPEDKQSIGIRKDGSSFWEDRRSFVIDWDNEPAVCSMRIDISESKNSELALIESEARLRAVIDASPAAITLKDRDGRYLLVNKVYTDWWNIENKMALGKSIREFIPQDQAGLVNSFDQIVLETGEMTQHEGRIQYGDGKTRIAEVTKSPVYSAEGEIVAIFSIIFDITDRKLLEDKLNQSQRMEAVGQLTGGVAHDFNNLLAIMIGNTEMLEDRISNDEQAREYIENLMRAIDRASSLTNRLLAFSRQQPLASEVTDIAKFVVGLADMLQRILGETIVLGVETSGDLWSVLVDPHQLDNALLNLALNSRDAMPDGGTLSIETSNVTLDEGYAEQHEDVAVGDYVQVTVCDTGIGMTPEVREKVFEPFFTTKDVGQGSGLGLSMVFGFVKQSKGHISILSEEGTGTSVSLYLPVAKEEAKEKEDDQPSFKTDLNKKTILVVEDDPEVRKMANRMLGSFGYEVIEVVDAVSAIGILEERSDEIDLIFSDIVMPNSMSGIDLAETVAVNYKDIKVLLTSGYPDKIANQDAFKKLNIRLLAKPYKRDELIAVIEEITS